MKNFLNDLLARHIRITKKHEPSLKRLRIKTVSDLLFHFPVRYSDVASATTVSHVEHNQSVTLFGHIHDLKTRKSWTTKKSLSEGKLTDIEGNTIKVMWFHQPYIAKMLHNDQVVKLTGTISIKKNIPTLMNPEIEKLPELPIDTHQSLFQNKDADIENSFGYPLYRETRGITSKWMYHAVTKLLANPEFEHIQDPIPDHILKKYNLPGLQTALVWIHMPQKASNAEAARKRFAFQEMFAIHLEKQQSRWEYNQLYNENIELDIDKVNGFIDRFPFTLTGAQQRVVGEIVADLQQAVPMSRLVEGDVGSGKTAIAAVATYATISNTPTNQKLQKKQSFGNLQVAYMAPTEVLATQLFEGFIEYFQHMPVKIVLMTGKTCRVFPSKVNPNGWTTISKSQAKKWIANGEVPIVIGTHSLISKSVSFKNLALVIVDEQHRFGTRQRMELAKKENHAPHYLSMTATPIPRTLALTIYGDLDLSVIDHMPPGRKPVATEITPPEKREPVYEFIRNGLKEGRQAYVICPRIFSPNEGQAISESEWAELSAAKKSALRLKSVEAESERLQADVFPEYRIGILHSKMKKDEKEDIMQQFKNHELDIMVATSVIEVGVSVPNSTMIIIEGAERYGLAQLHQLRGRVIRSNHQAYCWLFADIKSDTTAERLRALTEAKNGFELAEYDLALRGAGDLTGAKQWGVSDLAMEAIKNRRLVEAASSEARIIIAGDPHLESYTELKSLIDTRGSAVHFE